MLAPNLKYIPLFFLLLALNSFAQKKSYDGQGAVSEIIMASPAEMVGHFDMYFNSKVSEDDGDKQLYWYKIVFAKDCSFDFTLFPLVETDRYSFVTFKSQNDMTFCDAKAKQTITPIRDIQVKKEYKDHDQTESFRANLVTTKKTAMKAGEVLYIVVKNLWGKDMGHIIGLNTCDYSYVFEVQKQKPKTESANSQDAVYSELQDEEALAAIGRKLCPPDGLPIKLGTINFNKNVDVTNQLYAKGESTTPAVKKIVPTDLTLPKSVEPKPEAKPEVKVIATKDSVIKKPEVKAQSVSSLPKPEVWLKEKKQPAVIAESKKNKQAEVKLVPVKCLITDAVKGVGIDNLPIIVDELTGKPLVVKRLNTGEYEFAVEKGKNYKVECNAIGYKNFDHSINVYKALNGEENELELKLQPLVAGENFILKNIYFNANTPVIKNESNKELEKLYTFMKNNAVAEISIEGHTNSNRHISRDSRRQQLGGKWAFHGSAKKLSKYRADEVRTYLLKKGIEPDRIKTEGWGGDHELYPNARTLEESSKNMRVEVVILKI